MEVHFKEPESPLELIPGLTMGPNYWATSPAYKGERGRRITKSLHSIQWQSPASVHLFEMQNMNTKYITSPKMHLYKVQSKNTNTKCRFYSVPESTTVHLFKNRDSEGEEENG